MSSFHEWLETFGLTAPWLQAYGSIFALGLAIWISSRQARRERTRERDKLWNYMKAVLAISQSAHTAARTALDDMKDPAFIYESVRTKELENSLAALTTVTLESLPDEVAFMAIYRIRKSLTWVLEVAQAEAKHSSSQGVNPDLLRGVTDVLSQVDAFHSDFKRALESV